MLETLISNKTRIKLIMRFFLNPESRSYLRKMEEEFGESTNAIRIELNRFEKAGLLSSYTEMNKKFFMANVKHPLYNEINSIVKKYLGLDLVLLQVVAKLGNISKAYLIGKIANGLPGKNIELVLIGENFNIDYLNKLSQKVEELIKRKVNYILIDSSNSATELKKYPEHLLVWKKSK